MTREIEIYANYGCLAAEKRTVYTYGCEAETATVSDVVRVRIPEGWKLYETESGMKVTAPWGWDYEINEVLADKNDKPMFRAIDKDGRTYTAELEVIE